jgi:hypothetical protein
MIEIFIAAALGAAWRVWDGAGWGKTTMRSVVLLCLVLGLMSTKINLLIVDSWPMWIWAVSIVAALQRGFDAWENFDIRQITQYYYAALPLPILVWAYNLNYEAPLFYVALLLVAGLAHPVVTKMNIHTRWAEGVAGACLVGGVLV